MRLVESPITQRAITVVIVVNAVTLGLETAYDRHSGPGVVLHLIDMAALSIFVIELALKLFAYGGSFFRSGWNLFDLATIAVSLIPAAGNLSVLRAFRVLRVLRFISVVPSLRIVVQALLGALPSMFSITAILGLIFYVFAVLATSLFGNVSEKFASLEVSLFTLFQIMTLDDWSGGIVQPVMREYQWAWAFFLPFIIVSSFAVLNLFIGVLTSNIDAQSEARDLLEARHIEALEGQVADLRSELTAIRALLERQQET
ncbi:MAG: hypothetical protein RLZZ387_4504 [Chloroflexota bacterium]|jgi:voltage-gated sodium channel